MKVTIRVHRQHDMDLMSIHRNKAYHLAREMKRALVAYANNEDYTAPEVNFENEIDGYVPTSVVLHISLDEKKEADQKAIALLDHIRKGYRCSFIKALFRSSCLYLPLLAYADNSGFKMKRPGSGLRVASDVLDNKLKEIDKKHELVEPANPVEPVTMDPVPAPVFEPKQVVAEEKDPESITDTQDLDALFNNMDGMIH